MRMIFWVGCFAVVPLVFGCDDDDVCADFSERIECEDPASDLSLVWSAEGDDTCDTVNRPRWAECGLSESDVRTCLEVLDECDVAGRRPNCSADDDAAECLFPECRSLFDCEFGNEG